MKTAFYLGTLVLLASPTGAPDSPRFAPAEGSVLRRTIEFQSSYELTDLSVDMEGQKRKPPALPEFTIENAQRLVVRDEFVALGDGRPEKLLRSFEECENNQNASRTPPSGGEPQKTSVVMKTDLLGNTVVFTWNPKSESYDVEAAEESNVEAELLEGLVEDMDLRGLLPTTEVDEGSSWSLDGAALAGFVHPGGDLHEVPEGAEDKAQSRRELDVALYESLTGEGKATYAGTRDVDGVQVAVIEIEAAFDLEGEVAFQGEGVPNESTRRVHLKRMVQGELLWSLEHGHAIALALEGEATLEEVLAGETNRGQMVQTQTLEGTIRYAVTVERED